MTASLRLIGLGRDQPKRLMNVALETFAPEPLFNEGLMPHVNRLL